MQDQRFSVTRRSTNIWREYMNYLWDTDKTGKNLNKPEKGFDHSLDGIRYFMQLHLKNANQTDVSEFYERLRYKKRGTEKGIKAGLR